MKKTCLLFSLLLMFSCNATNKVSSAEKPDQAQVNETQETKTEYSFISGTRQKVFPGVDDGSGRYTENWILKLDLPRDFIPQISIEYMGYIIPVDRVITYISDKEKSVLMFSITYPLMDNYDASDRPPNAKPILFLRGDKKLITLDISGCQNISPVAYPTMQKEGGY